MAQPATEVQAADLRESLRARGTFLVRGKRSGVGKTGKPWLQLMLGDRTGTIDARVWENADRIDAEIQEQDLVDVEGMGVRFMDQIQLKVFKVERASDPDLDPAAFMPTGNRSPEELRQAYEAHAAKLANPWLVKLFRAYLDDEAWWERFARGPAAKTIHHAYLGGLAEHTLSMMDLCRTIGEHYLALGVAPLSVDLLVMGGFLHDTGKLDELSSEGAFDYTDEGRLIGHITLGLDALDERIREIEGFPGDLRTHLRHLVLSHHGEYEYGSPRRPKTVEAMILHFIDNLDARVEIVHQAIRDAGKLDSNWTGFAPALGRHVYRRPPASEDDGGED